MKRILIATILAFGLAMSYGFFASKTHLMKATATVRADEGCSLASLNGTYAVEGQGTVIGQLPGFPAPPFPFGEVSVAHLNGAGSFSGNTTANLGGLVATISFTGTYTVNSDCTGTVTVNTSSGLTTHDAIVVVGGGRQIIATDTDPFEVVQRKAERLGE